jgi:hypothetical protein
MVELKTRPHTFRHCEQETVRFDDHRCLLPPYYCHFITKFVVDRQSQNLFRKEFPFRQQIARLSAADEKKSRTRNAEKISDDSQKKNASLRLAD